MAISCSPIEDIIQPKPVSQHSKQCLFFVHSLVDWREIVDQSVFQTSIHQVPFWHFYQFLSDIGKKGFYR